MSRQIQIIIILINVQTHNFNAKLLIKVSNLHVEDMITITFIESLL